MNIVIIPFTGILSATVVVASKFCPIKVMALIVVFTVEMFHMDFV